MTCAEFERVLPELGDSFSIEQETHLRSCHTCSDLVADLNAITQQARRLDYQDEPSPRVWNSIEITLRHEGLIGQLERKHSPVPARSRVNWRLQWLVPMAAAFLVTFGVLLHLRSPLQLSQSQPASVNTVKSGQTAIDNPVAFDGEDQKLLTTITERMPSMRAAYEADLRTVNAYVRDAKLSAQSDPNDEVAQQYLMNAYEQRAMVYEMALDRSLP